MLTRASIPLACMDSMYPNSKGSNGSKNGYSSFDLVICFHRLILRVTRLVKRHLMAGFFGPSTAAHISHSL